jgi:pimeloyl-ACP methyl ester carboxylesterase
MRKRKSAPVLSQFRVPRSAFIVLIIAQAIIIPGCGARRTPDLERIFAGARARTGKRPVIVIPGILGSQMVNRRTGEVVWPSLLRSSDDNLGLPVSPDLNANRDHLTASKILETVKLARIAPDVYIYYELLKTLERYGGYREGDWENPPPGGDRDTFYVFPYDWRRDNVETAQELVRRVGELKRKLGREDLKFNVVAHSMGGLVARYAAMYGGADLPAEGEIIRPTWAGADFINKIFMFGTPNEGSAEALTTLLEGFSVTEGLRRRVRLLNKLPRDEALTIPSIFQLLPHRETARFLDEELRPVEVDLYDPEVWRRYGWAAVSDPAFRERFARAAARDKAGETSSDASGDAKDAGDAVKGSDAASSAAGAEALARLDAYFAAVLARARRFHEAIDALDTSAHAPVQLYAFGGDCEETLAAPVLLRDEKRALWLTLTAPRSFRTSAGRKVTSREAVRAMYEPGDGRVTRRSLMGEGLSSRRGSVLFNTPLPVAYVVFACDLHSELHNNKTLQNNALTLLVNELTN